MHKIRLMFEEVKLSRFKIIL